MTTWSSGWGLQTVRQTYIANGQLTHLFGSVAKVFGAQQLLLEIIPYIFNLVCAVAPIGKHTTWTALTHLLQRIKKYSPAEISWGHKMLLYEYKVVFFFFFRKLAFSRNLYSKLQN